MEYLSMLFPIAMIAVGVFLTLFFGIYMKRREVGPGMDTAQKRIAVYVATGIGLMFLGGGMVFLVVKF
jgi:uncharacterized membrane protein YhiD involved in acid resistance